MKAIRDHQHNSKSNIYSIKQVLTHITIRILDIIHNHVSYLEKKNVSKTAFCLRLQVVHIQLGPNR
jgi:hypothetical protein